MNAPTTYLISALRNQADDAPLGLSDSSLRDRTEDLYTIDDPTLIYCIYKGTY